MNSNAIAACGQIPQFLRSPSDKFVPTPTSEVQRELDQLHMELGDLESLVNDLVIRLGPVLLPNSEPTTGGANANCSSQIGQQISSGAYRVATLSSGIRGLLSSLAV